MTDDKLIVYEGEGGPIRAAQLVDIASEIANMLLVGGYGGIDFILEALDQDPSWENAATFVGFLSGAQNMSQWGIGEILYFLRHRATHSTVAEFEYADGDEWPEHLHDFIQARYNRGLVALLADPSNTIADILGWTIYRFNPFWLLVGKGYIRVWHREAKPEPTDEEWSDAIERTFGGAMYELNEKTARSYYSVVATYPGREDRIDGVSWAGHLAMRNQIGNEFPRKEISGDARHEAIGKVATQRLEEAHAAGKATVPHIRSGTAEINREAKGFVWEFPQIALLWIRDPETDTYYEALRLIDGSFEEYFLYHTGLSRRTIPDRIPLVYDDRNGRILTADAEVVAIFLNCDVLAIQKAADALVKKMKMKVTGIDV